METDVTDVDVLCLRGVNIHSQTGCLFLSTPVARPSVYRGPGRSLCVVYHWSALWLTAQSSAEFTWIEMDFLGHF
jgi:hypothetical protein